VTAVFSLCISALLVGAACSNSSGSNRPSMDGEAAVNWFGEAMEAARPCQGSVEALGTAWKTAPSGPDESIPMLYAAGQGIEDCSIQVGDEERTKQWDDLMTQWPHATTLLRNWTEAVVATDYAALAAAATNLDNRPLVGELVSRFREADEIADAFEQAIREFAESLGIDVPAGDLLRRFDPPDH